MQKEILTPSGAIAEATEAIRIAKRSCGKQIEREVAKKKLAEIQNPGSPELTGVDYSIDQSIKTRFIYLEGVLEDYSDILGGEQSPIEKGVRSIQEKASDSIRRELKETTEAYNNLKFSPDEDPTQVAKNEAEKSMILEAAQLLGYTVTNAESGARFTPTPRYKTGGDLEKVIANRIGIGIRYLLEDYENQGEVRRPVRRTIVAMADHMAKILRGKEK